MNKDIDKDGNGANKTEGKPKREIKNKEFAEKPKRNNKTVTSAEPISKHSDKFRKPKQFDKPVNLEIDKRNKLIIKLFRMIDLPIRLIGDDVHPAIVYNDEIELNCKINNFELIFLDAPSSKNVIYTVKLNHNPIFDKNQILKCISDYKAKSVFKVALDSKPKLFLTGYAFLNKEEKLGRYPIFSSYNPRIYFSEEKAKEISEELKSNGYSAIFE